MYLVPLSLVVLNEFGAEELTSRIYRDLHFSLHLWYMMRFSLLLHDMGVDLANCYLFVFCCCRKSYLDTDGSRLIGPVFREMVHLSDPTCGPLFIVIASCYYSEILVHCNACSCVCTQYYPPCFTIGTGFTVCTFITLQ